MTFGFGWKLGTGYLFGAASRTFFGAGIPLKQKNKQWSKSREWSDFVTGWKFAMKSEIVYHDVIFKQCNESHLRRIHGIPGRHANNLTVAIIGRVFTFVALWGAWECPVAEKHIDEGLQILEWAPGQFDLRIKAGSAKNRSQLLYIQPFFNRGCQYGI